MGIPKILPSIQQCFSLNDQELSLYIIHTARRFSAYQVGLRLLSCYVIQSTMNGREARTSRPRSPKRRRQGYMRALERILLKIRELVTLYQDRVETITVPEENPLLAAAREGLGTDASPSDLAPDELGCAETVSEIIRTVSPDVPRHHRHMDIVGAPAQPFVLPGGV